MSEDRIKLEERIAHLERVNEELSEIVADLATRLSRAEGKVAQLQEGLKDLGDQGGGVVFGEKPPHY